MREISRHALNLETPPARFHAQPYDIEKAGDWSLIENNPHVNDGKRTMIVRCPLCSADGWYPSRPKNFVNYILENFLGAVPHAGSLACPQNPDHNFVLLNKKTWLILKK